MNIDHFYVKLIEQSLDSANQTIQALVNRLQMMEGALTEIRRIEAWDTQVWEIANEALKGEDQ